MHRRNNSARLMSRWAAARAEEWQLGVIGRHRVKPRRAEAVWCLPRTALRDV